MNLTKFLFFAIIALLLLILTISCDKCKDDIVVNVVGKVVDKNTQNPIEGAKIIYNATENYLTDVDGEFRTTYNLKRLLADSISFFVTKENYKSVNYSTIIGNTQKDIFVIQIEPK